MDLSDSVKSELTLCQQKLRGAIGLHQRIYKKLKANPKDKRELSEKLVNAQKLIKAIAKQQKPLIQNLRDDLDKYHEKLKKENKQINYEADTAFIELQLEEYQYERNKCKNLLTRQSTSSISDQAISIERPSRERISRTQPSKRTSASGQDEKSQEPLEKRKLKYNPPDPKPKSKILQDGRSKLLSALDKVCKQNSPSASTISPVQEPADILTEIKSEKLSEPSSPELLDIKEATEVPRINIIKEETPDLTDLHHTPSPVPEYESEIACTPEEGETSCTITTPDQSNILEKNEDRNKSESADEENNELDQYNESKISEKVVSEEYTDEEMEKTEDHHECTEDQLEPDSKEHFLRYLNIFTHQQCSRMITRRLQRKKHLNVNAIDPKLFCRTPENKKKRKKKLYLQQYTPPMTRGRTNGSSKTTIIENKNSKNLFHVEELTNFKIKERKAIPEKLATSPKLKTELSDKEDVCLVCQSNDGEAVNCCELCGEYYHLLCHGSGPLHIQKRMCPYCICRSSSPETNKDYIRMKKEQRNKLLQLNRHLRYEVQDLDLLASELCVKIKRQNYKRDQLLCDQVIIKNNLKNLLGFVAQIKNQISTKEALSVSHCVKV